MAQPKRARVKRGLDLRLKIDKAYDSDHDHGDVDNGGQVFFRVDPKGGAWVYTDPPDAFVGETGGCLKLNSGDNGPFTPSMDDFIITYCCCAPQSKCSPLSPKQGGGYTIGVGNPPGEPFGRKKK